MSTTPPPGWYDTGVPGEQGWWDGMQWTPHRRPAPPAQTPAPQPAATRPPQAPAAAPQGTTAPRFGWGPPWLSITVGAILAVVSMLVGLLTILIMAFGAAPHVLLTGFLVFAAAGVLAGLAFANAAGAAVKRRVAPGAR
ncbi:hypothetical protein [Microbacterium sp. GXF7504]